MVTFEPDWLFKFKNEKEFKDKKNVNKDEECFDLGFDLLFPFGEMYEPTNNRTVVGRMVCSAVIES